MDARSKGYTYDNGDRSKPRLALLGQAQQWPTPASRDYRTPNHESLEARGGGGKGEQLPNFVAHHWPTPNAAVFEPKAKPPIKGNRKPTDPQISTADVAVHLFCSHPDPATSDGPPSCGSGPNLRLRLSPIFGAWLMGWPLTWAIAEPHASSASATASWRRAQLWHLSNLCGVPAGSAE